MFAEAYEPIRLFYHTLMRPNIRWQFVLAMAGLGLVFSLLSYQVQTVGLCSTRVPAGGGQVVQGIIGIPQYINPLLSDPNPVDQELVSLIFDGMTRYNMQGQLEPVLATGWSVSDDGMVVQMGVRDDVQWHDGTQLTAQDVVFTYQLLQDEAFPAPAGLRTLWQSVTIEQTAPFSLTFTLTEPFSPFLEATTRGILPAHILQSVPAGQIANHPFNHNPVGTGAFMMPENDNWERTGRLHLRPNPANYPLGIQLDGLEYRFFADATALSEAYRAGDIHAITNISYTDLPDLIGLPGLRAYTNIIPRYTELLFNLGLDDSAPVQDRAVRQALAFGVDRSVLIERALNGQGVPLDGPYVSSSWAYKAGVTAYGYNPTEAVVVLDEAGWELPAGSTLRQQTGTPLTLRLLLLDNSTHIALASELTNQWAQINIGINQTVVGQADYQLALEEGNFDIALIDITPPNDPDLYDFWSQEAIVRGQNYAGWNNRRASEALEQARQLWDTGERQPYYDAFLQFYHNDLPALTLYQPVTTYGISDSVNRVDIGRIDHPRERYDTLADWFLLYRDVTISCPDA